MTEKTNSNEQKVSPSFDDFYSENKDALDRLRCDAFAPMQVSGESITLRFQGRDVRLRLWGVTGVGVNLRFLFRGEQKLNASIETLFNKSEKWNAIIQKAVESVSESMGEFSL